ncbi:MAG: hypothetical protein HC933_02390 [Pleurocapsa sp. SU_196_0]|nr:hypothetical protein [Pleurocapsa sp. SU_196_0]
MLIFNAAIALFPILAMAYFLRGSSFNPWLLAWLGFVVIFSVGFGWVVANALLHPINTLRDELSALAAQRQLGFVQRLEENPGQPIEVRTLRRAFSALLDSLRVEQQKRGAFMATLVHDLKTPIIAANHVLEAIERDDNLSREMRIELISSVRTEFEALLRRRATNGGRAPLRTRGRGTDVGTHGFAQTRLAHRVATGTHRAGTRRETRGHGSWAGTYRQ